MDLLKKSILIIFFCWSFTAGAQHCDSILWSKHRDLKMSYFKAPPDKNNRADAVTAAGITYTIVPSQRYADFEVYCSFYPCRSWMKVKSKPLLEHEQTHFDIAEYHKRLLMKEIMNREFTAANIMPGVQEIGAMITGLRNEMDQQYDLETQHSVQADKQKEWTKRMDKLLRKIDVYEANRYRISLH